MRTILTLLVQLIFLQQVAAQGMVTKFIPNERPDFESIYQGTETFTLKGKLPFENQDFVEFFITDLHQQDEVLAVELQPDGSFEKSFPLLGGQNLIFDHGDRYEFQIQPGDTLELYQKQPNTALQIIQRDQQALRDIEQLIQQYHLQYGAEANHIFRNRDPETDHQAVVDNYFNKLVQYVYDQRDPTVHHRRIDELVDDEYWRLNYLMINGQQSVGFINYSEETKQKIKEKSQLYLGKAFSHPRALQRSIPQEVLSSLPVYDDRYISSATYRNFLHALLDYQLVGGAPLLYYRTSTAGPLMQLLHRIIGTYGYSGLISENMVYGQVVRNAKRYDSDDALQGIHFAQEFIQSPFLKSKLAEFESFYKTLDRGMPAPDFEFIDREGNPVKLSDFKGKLVYLDFWGVYCGPCLSENEIAPALYTHYADQDLVFVNICIDVDQNKWHAQLQEERPNVIELYAVGKTRNEYVKSYHVSGIPHYYIIDQEGKIQDNQAPRPSSLLRNLESNALSRLLK